MIVRNDQWWSFEKHSLIRMHITKTMVIARHYLVRLEEKLSLFQLVSMLMNLKVEGKCQWWHLMGWYVLFLILTSKVAGGHTKHNVEYLPRRLTEVRTLKVTLGRDINRFGKESLSQDMLTLLTTRRVNNTNKRFWRGWLEEVWMKSG